MGGLLISKRGRGRGLLQLLLMPPHTLPLPAALQAKHLRSICSRPNYV